MVSQGDAVREGVVGEGAGSAAGGSDNLGGLGRDTPAGRGAGAAQLRVGAAAGLP